MVSVLLAGANMVTAAKVTPVQKVIELLQNMVDKGTKEKQDEQVQFASFKGFCDNTVSQKQAAIAEATEMIEVLTADIEKYEAEAAELSKAITGHDADISTWEGDVQAAEKVREIEHVDYVATHKDYSESINALNGAIEVIKKASGKTPGAAAALMQVKASRFLPKEATNVIESFLATSNAESAPEANAYESQSNGIIDMLEKLAGKFEDERTTLEEEETTAKHSFEMLSADLTRTLDAAKAQREEKSVAKGKALQGAADAKGALGDTTTTRDDDSKYAADLTATCEQKSSDFANRQILRAEEIEAVKKAMEILSSGAVAGASEKHLPQLMQLKTSFAQLRSDTISPVQKTVAAYLTKQAGKLNSRILSVFALRVAADPFKKVKKMIKDLIVKLMEEANAEAEQKGFCDKELATNEHTRKEKSEAVVMLTAEIDELSASVAALAEQITDLTKQVAELDAAVAKATAERTSEKEKNTIVIKDAKAAQTAVASALSVLNEFYAKAATATSFAQEMSGSKEPEVFGDEPYKGMGGESGGVVGMIEVIQSDFARLEAETSASEAESAKEYDEFMTDSKIDKVEKSSDIEHQSESKQSQEQSLQEKKVDLEGTQKELDAAMAYYEKLKPTCVSSGPTYEEKVAARKAEIESLQTALQVLNGEDIAM